MSALLKIFFVVAPLIGQGILQAQGALGVTHPTVAGSIAGWLIALTLSGRALANPENKNATPPG